VRSSSGAICHRGRGSRRSWLFANYDEMILISSRSRAIIHHDSAVRIERERERRKREIARGLLVIFSRRMNGRARVARQSVSADDISLSNHPDIRNTTIRDPRRRAGNAIRSAKATV
jgi:hypothetical protein